MSASTLDLPMMGAPWAHLRGGVRRKREAAGREEEGSSSGVVCVLFFSAFLRASLGEKRNEDSFKILD